MVDRAAGKGGFASFPLRQDAVRVVDPLTVAFVTSEPDLRLPEQLVHIEGSSYRLKDRKERLASSAD